MSEVIACDFPSFPCLYKRPCLGSIDGGMDALAQRNERTVTANRPLMATRATQTTLLPQEQPQPIPKGEVSELRMLVSERRG